MEAMVVVVAQRIQADLMVRNVDETNRGMRHGAYTNFTFWKHGKLGRGNRRVIPSCCVWKIRARYASSNGLYKGFREAP